MKHFFLIALIYAFAPFSAHADSDVEITKVRDNIHMLASPQGGNVVVATGEDGTFVIDDQLTDRSRIIMEAIKGLSDRPVKFILNTHYHFDHTGGNEAFGSGGAIIVAQDNVRKRLSSKQFITFFGKEMEPLSKAGLPVVTFADDMTLHYNGDDVRMVHLRSAHTDGDAAAYFAGANVIVAGDVIFNNMYPFIDVEHGGSIKGVIAALDTFLNIADDNTVIVPGHGPLMNKAQVAAYQQVLKTIEKKIRVAMTAAEGKTLKEIQESKPTQAFDEKMGGGIIAPDAFVEIVYTSLALEILSK